MSFCFNDKWGWSLLLLHPQLSFDYSSLQSSSLGRAIAMVISIHGTIGGKIKCQLYSNFHVKIVMHRCYFVHIDFNWTSDKEVGSSVRPQTGPHFMCGLHAPILDTVLPSSPWPALEVACRQFLYTLMASLDLRTFAATRESQPVRGWEESS